MTKTNPLVYVLQLFQSVAPLRLMQRKLRTPENSEGLDTGISIRSIPAFLQVLILIQQAPIPRTETMFLCGHALMVVRGSRWL